MHPATHPPCRTLSPQRATWAARALASLLALCLALPAQAATTLADQPLFSNNAVPGNLALPLSVEYPTAVSVAHVDNVYASSSTYLGYFDTEKCYVYTPVDVESASLKTHFAPAGAAASHLCSGANDYKWSGNFLNWAAMQTIDPFRSALTGGYRVVDTPTLTILEKAWASGQGGTGNFPMRLVTDVPTIAGATPFIGLTAWNSYIAGYGQNLLVGLADGATNIPGGFLGVYYNSIDLSGTPVLTRYENVNFNFGVLSPAPGIVNQTNFSVRWTSQQVAPSTGNYSFQTVSDDGVRLWVNGVLVIDNWSPHAATVNTSANVALNAGDPLNLRIEYFQAAGAAVMQLSWKPPGTFLYVPYTVGDYLRLPMRAKVCDPSAAAGSLEANCKAYSGGNYKPEGLMQQYASRIRYSVFGYLNDSNIQRDGGVLRAQQKFVGPTYPRPGLTDATNAAQEWDPSTGVFVTNPDTADATSTTTMVGSTISNSGVLNYLNKFGEINRAGYKTYDPVSELYYASIRYYKNQGNVSAWTDMTGASSATKATYADGFPVITAWNDPILYSCQRNFILGIGDVNTHADANVAGSPTPTGNEPTKPPEVVADTTVNAVTATNQIGVMQGLGASLGTTNPYNGCCNNNTALMAGLAYDANTVDIRPDLPNVAGTVGQTVQTFWVDVLEGQVFKANNQFYLAAKYGGFKAPSTFAPYAAGATLQTSWWNTTTDTVSDGIVTQPRPDNYFTAGRPDLMVSGLTTAFASIASQLKAYTTSFSTASPQLSSTGNASYAASYDSSAWTGDLIASTLNFDPTTGAPSTSKNWSFSDVLGVQAAASGWDTGRNIATWNSATAAGVPFRYAQISSAQQSALDTTYRSGNDGSDYLNYLRGDRSQEQASTVSGSSKAYRTRTKLLGDIVGSKTRPVGPPSMPLANAANPGYSAFKSTYANRTTMVYVGANDGMLHGVIGALTGTGAGAELFGYVPAALYNGPTTPGSASNASVDGLAGLGLPAFAHHYYVNATPTVYDIDFAKTQGSSGSPNWHSVLIGGLGKGGKSYYALDVTDPSTFTSETAVASKVLWEFTDADLGFSFGEPAMVKTKKYGWVAIFGSGYNNSSGRGYFFIVNPRTGALLEKVATGAGSSSNDAGMAHLNAFVIDRTDGTADSVYAGDLLGNVWRLDVTAASGAYPAPVQLAQLTDPGTGAVQPVTSRLLIAVQPVTNKRFVLVGTGRLLDITDSATTQGQSFYALMDGTGTRFNATANLPVGVTFPIGRSNLVANTNPLVGVTYSATSMGWYLDLGNGAGNIGWRDVSDSTSYYNTVSFATTLPSGNACSPSGSSAVYSLDFGTGVTALTVTTTTGSGSTLVTTVTPIVSNTTFTGAVTDLNERSVNGQEQLVGGDVNGTLQNIEKKKYGTAALRRLNWRELPIAD